MSNKVVVGEILSETAFYKVEKLNSDGSVVTRDDFGNEITLGARYVASDILTSADKFSSTEEKTATELAELFKSSPRVAMTVEFVKKDEKKKVGALKKEIAEWAETVKNEFLAKGISALEAYASKPVLPYIPGENRVMRGRHYGGVDDFGRVHFIDMDVEKGNNPAHDARARQVDPRTLVSLIIEGVKYTKKK